jgi:hypothetical protein
MTVKYTHLHDPENPDRVLTLAREFDSHTQSVKFGWSINRPPQRIRAFVESVREENIEVDPKYRNHYANGTRTKRVKTYEIVERKLRGDIFCKKTGREQSERRLRESPIVINGLTPNETPLFAVLFSLVMDRSVPESVSSIAQYHARFTPELRSDLQYKDSVQKSFLDRFMSFLRGA